MNLILTLFLATILTCLRSLYTGVTLWLLWAWFVAKTFKVQELSFVEAVGLMVVAEFVLMIFIPSKKVSGDDVDLGADLKNQFVLPLIGSLVCIAVGFIVSRFT